MTKLLTDPQQQNSYSYVANRPMVAKDTSGHFLFLLAPVIPILAEYVGATALTASVLYVARDDISNLVGSVILIKDFI